MKLTKKLTNILILVGVILGGIGIDQLTKILVSKNMALYESIPVIPKVFNITYIQNRGAAFGMLSDKIYVVLPITVVVIGICIFIYLKNKGESKIFDYAMLLIVTGAIGNVMDKLTRGFVVDFLNFEFMDFPVFNVADISVCTGAGLLIIYILFCSDKKKEAEGKADDTDM